MNKSHVVTSKRLLNGNESPPKSVHDIFCMNILAKKLFDVIETIELLNERPSIVT